MASAFLKKKAEQSKQRIDQEYGHGTYGSSGASEFLKKKAAAAKEGIDVKFGDSAYGGSKYDMNKRSYATPDLFANLYDYASGLRSQLDTTKNAAHGSNFSDYANIKDYENSQSAKTALPDLQKQYDEAMQYYYSYLPYASDYAELSKAGDSKSNKSKLLSAYNIGGDTVYDYINNINGISETLGSQDAPKSPYTKYSYMNDDEKGVYNYVYAKYGKDAAASYLDGLTETLNYRYGNNIYENIKDKPALKYTTAASAGMQSFFEGMGQLFSKDALPTSETQYAYQNVQKDLADKGPKILSKSLGQIGADLIYTASNMLPSILLSVVGGQLLGAAGITTGTAAKLAGAAGAASLGTSAGGNAYNQAIKDGFTQEQAKNYAALIGVSESALQYALGGISKLGGLSANKIASVVGKIDSGFLRAAATIGIDMASEGIEEGLQEVLGTLFSNSILGTKDSVNWENVAYAAVLGAVMGGVFEGSNVALEGGVPYTGNNFKMSDAPGYKGASNVDYFDGVTDYETLQSRYHELAKVYSPDLHQDRAAEYTEIMKDINNQHDMIEAFYRAKATVTGEEIQDETADAGYTAEDETGLIRLLNESGTQKPVETVEDGLASPVEAVSEQQPITTPEAIKVLEQAATEMHSKPVEKPAISKPLEEKPAAVGPITSVAQPAAQTGNATKVPDTSAKPTDVAETEAAKKRLKEARIKSLGKNGTALLEAIEGGKISIEDITISKSNVPGFTSEQRTALIKGLIEGVKSDADNISIKIPDDGTFTAINVPENVAAYLEKLGAKIEVDEGEANIPAALESYLKSYSKNPDAKTGYTTINGDYYFTTNMLAYRLDGKSQLDELLKTYNATPIEKDRLKTILESADTKLDGIAREATVNKNTNVALWNPTPGDYVAINKSVLKLFDAPGNKFYYNKNSARSAVVARGQNNEVIGFVFRMTTAKDIDFETFPIIKLKSDKTPVAKKPLTTAKPESTIKADNATTEKGAANGTKHVDEGTASAASVSGETGGRTLEGVASENIPETGERGDAVSDTVRPGTQRVGSADGADASGDVGGRSLGDSEGSDIPSVGKVEEKTPVAQEAEVKEAVALTGADTSRGNNYVIGNSLNLPSGEKSRYNSNVKAIKIVKKCILESRWATAEEQDALSKYVGWGGLPNAFDKSKSEWAKEYKELKELLTTEEYEAARASTLNAHYTSIDVIHAMYEGLRGLGFKGGRLIEPASGTGNFVGAMPSDMQNSVKSWTMVELDNITGNIAKYLYPNNDVRIQGFEKAVLPENFFDVAISNVPFGNFGVVDKAYPRIVTSSIHNYFFAKALDKVRPGGLVLFITSRYTMDSADISVRDYISKRADLIGAIRLPDTAFKANAGTEVVTDILVLKKRHPGDMVYAGEEFINAEYSYIDGRSAGTVNGYFKNHPEMVLGTASMTGTMYGRSSLTYKALPGNLSTQIKKAFGKIKVTMDYPQQSPKEYINSIAADRGKETKKNGLVSKDGKIYVQTDTGLETVPVEGDQAKRITGILGIRDVARELLNSQLNGKSEAEIKVFRDKLNSAYDSFISKFGYINIPANVKLVKSDPDFAFVSSLESYDKESKTAKKSDIFTKNTVAKNITVTHVDSASEALIVSINETGDVNLKRISELTGIEQDNAARQLMGAGLIYKTRNGNFETAETYLSGNVKAKLKDAEPLSMIDADYKRNVEALKKVIPKDIPYQSIYINPGATWIPTAVYNSFGAHMTGSRESSYDPPVSVKYNSVTGEWTVESSGYVKYSVDNRDTWGTPDKSFLQLYTALLNSKSITVRRKDSDGNSFVDKQATIAANEKIEQIKTEFRRWIWEDEKRRDTLALLYNDINNNIAIPKYDGSNLTVDGANAAKPLRAHQRDAVQRIISSGGNTLLAHAVGAGKTYEMAAAAMKLRQLGIVKKPLFVVPKSLVAQWGREYIDFFPNARLLVAGDADTQKANRRAFANRIATGDYDSVIISYENFKALPMSPESQVDFINEQIVELQMAIQAAGKRDPSVKQMEKKKKSLELKIAKLGEMKKDADNINFEELGVDSLFVDEAHNYKNLFYITNMTNVSGLGNKEGSQRAFDLYSKMRYLQKLNGGRGIVFATATPVLNSMSEMYIMQKYLQYDMLKQRGLTSFDAWAAQFGEVRDVLEIKPSGKGYRQKQSFSRFKNIPELTQMFRSFADVLTEIPGMVLPTAKRETITAKPSQYVTDYIDKLDERATAISKGQVDPRQDNMLKITSDGRKISYTQRMTDPSLPYEPGNKISLSIDKTFEVWQNTKASKSAQLIFCDLATPKGQDTKSKADSDTDDAATADEEVENISIYNDIKKQLILKGIPAGEIAFIHDANTNDKKLKLFQNVNTGKVRVLIGSTGKMGVGMNAQKKLVALHHLDAPWRPGDVTQREGRIIRQGNENKEAFIYTYVTEGTFDARMWDGLERKSAFINAVMNGNTDIREMEDVGEQTLSFAEIKALASGNPLIQEQVEVNSKLQKLYAVKAEYVKSVQKAQYRLNLTKSEILSYDKLIESISKDLKVRQDVSGDKFSIIISGKAYTERINAGLAIITEAKALAKTENPEYKKIGTFGGFGVELNGKGELRLMGAGAYNAIINPESGGGTIQSLESVLRNLDTRLENTKSLLAQAEADIKKLQDIIAAPFDKQGELETLRKRSEEIMNELNPIESPEGALEGDEGDGDDTENLIYTDTKAQDIKSADTSINSAKLPAVFSRVTFEPGTVNLDIGGGRFDNVTEHLASIGVTNYIYDPYNRTNEHNDKVAKKTQEGQSDTVTISNVLNVIKEQKARDNVIANAVDAVKTNGTVYITVYEGNGQGEGRQTTKGWQENRKTVTYMSEIRKFFSEVTLRNNVIIAKYPNKMAGKEITDKAMTGGADRASQWQTTRTEGNAATAIPLSHLIKKIRDKYELPVSTGHIRGKGVLGQYARLSKSIRSRVANDLPTIAHELGHHFDNIHQITDTLKPTLKAELTSALSDEMRAAYKENKLPGEGMAEFLRKYLQNKDKTTEEYKLFTPYFLERLTASERIMLDEFSDQINAYYSQEILEKARGTIFTQESKGPDFRTTGEKTNDFYSKRYQQTIDTNHAIRIFDKETGSRVYINATNAAYVDARAEASLTGDLYDYNGNRVGPGLKQALDGIHLDNQTEYNDFGLYLVCQNGMERLRDGLRVFADDSINTVEAMDAMSQRLEQMYPAFKDAAAKLYDFQNQLVQSWLVDTGLISKDVAKEWAERWPHYVPFNRKFTDQFGAARAAGGVKRGYGNQQAPVMKAIGSGRAFVNPVDNIINNIVRYIAAGSYNSVASLLTDVANKTEDIAGWLEKVPSPLKKTEVDITGLKEKLKNVTSDSKLTSDVKNSMIEIITGLDDIITQYGRGKAHGDVITIMKSGKPEYWKVNDTLLLDSLINIKPRELPWILATFGRVSRFTMSNVTGKNIVWSIFSNFPRDLMTLFTYSKDKNPIHLIGGIAEGYLNKFKGAKADPIFLEYVAMGGNRTSAYTADKNLAKTIRTKLSGGNKLRWLNPLTVMLESFEFIGDMIEIGPRYAIYKIHRTRYGLNPQEAFYAAMDATVNFKKRGSAATMRVITNVIPFSGASIQGVDKYVRWATAEDAAKGERAKTARRRIVFYATISILLASLFTALNGSTEEDKENYAQLSNYTKNSYWCIPIGDGKYFCIPKPREIAVLTSLFETLIERYVYGNKDAFDEFYGYVADNLLPNVISDIAQLDFGGALGGISVIGVVSDLRANKDFLGKPIVSEGPENLEPKDQYTDRTSKLAYWIGQAFNISPQKVDYFAGQTLGGFWKWQKALLPVGSENVDLTLGVQSTYIKDNQYSTDVVNNLYTSYEDLKRKRGSNSNDMDIAVAFKDVSSLTTFYSRYNALAKNLPESEYNRAVRQTVLEMIIEHNKSASSGISTGVHDAVAAICKQQGDTELMPSTMNTYVTADDGTQYTLTAAQYVEYQTNYNRLYWEYVEDALSTANNQSAAYKAALVKAAKGRALTEAKGGVLSTKGVTSKDYTLAKSLENYGIDGTEHILFKAALDMVNEGGGSPTNDEIIEAINGMDGLTNRERYYLYHSKNDKDNNNPWAKYK